MLAFSQSLDLSSNSLTCPPMAMLTSRPRTETLGNLCTTPRAGLIFPDFDTGDALYVTGTTEIRAGKDAATVLPRSNVLVRLNVVAARFVEQGLGFLGQVGELSPYNPPIRFLATEQALPDVQTSNNRTAYAKLLSRELLTPTIARFRFSVSDPETAGRWKPGQYVALAFEDELSLGYSHMRDDDPKSLNDDYVSQSFRFSSPTDFNKLAGCAIHKTTYLPQSLYYN